MQHCQSLFMVRRTSLGFVAGMVLLHCVLTSVINLWAFPQGIFTPLHRATLGLISPTLVANVLMAAVMMWCLMRWGELTSRDLDLYPGKLPQGLLWLCAGWALVQATLLAVHGLRAEPLTVDPGWQGTGGFAQVGKLLGQLFGNALYEEVFFRAFLVPQLVLILKKRYRKWSWWRCLLCGLIISQLIFALIHIPNRIFKGTYTSVGMFLADQAGLFVAGILFAVVWLLSRNIFVPVALHALGNAPTSIWSLETHPEVTASLALALPWLAGQVWWQGRRGRRQEPS